MSQKSARANSQSNGVQQALPRLPLKITVVEGRGLKPTSKGTDPFVELRVKGEETFNRTSPKMKTHDPLWNESFQFTAKRTDILVIKLYDFKKKATKFDCLGEIEVPLEPFENKPKADIWREWKRKKKEDVWELTSGEVHITLEFGTPQPPPPPSAQQLPANAVPVTGNSPIPVYVTSSPMPYPPGYYPPFPTSPMMSPFPMPYISPYGTPMPSSPYAPAPISSTLYPLPPPPVDIPPVTITCSKCKKSNLFEAFFCSGCGNNLKVTCPKCKKVMEDSSAVFCNSCGNSLTIKDNPPPPSVDNNYQINFADLRLDLEVGRGAFGKVFKGSWRGGVVAIKKLTSHAKMNQRDLDDFAAEASVMAKLRPHTNVVQFLGITLEPLCIITEYMDKGSLHFLLHGDEKFDVNMLMKSCQGIAAGMHHLHSENIIHRDLASRNVLIGTGFQVKISDFGMARIAESGNKSNTTKNNSGPLKWMPPESILDRVYGPASDVWSYGVTVWEILSRSDPFPQYDAVQAALLITSDKERLRLQTPEICPQVLREVLARCFQENPASRPSFAEICGIYERAKLEEWTLTESPSQSSGRGPNYASFQK